MNLIDTQLGRRLCLQLVSIIAACITPLVALIHTIRIRIEALNSNQIDCYVCPISQQKQTLTTVQSRLLTAVLLRIPALLALASSSLLQPELSSEHHNTGHRPPFSLGVEGLEARDRAG